MRFAAIVLLLLSALPAHAARLIPVGGDPLRVQVNPVTNQVVIFHRGAFQSRISVLDPTNDLVDDLTLPAAIDHYIGADGAFELDPLRNRVYVRLVGGALVAVDLEALSTETVAVSPVGYLALDPGNDRLYATGAASTFNPYSAVPTLHVVNGETLDVESIDATQYFPGLDAVPARIGLTVDPRAGRAQLVGTGASNACQDYTYGFVELAGSPLQLVNVSPTPCSSSAYFTRSTAVDPFQRRTWYEDLYQTPRSYAWTGSPPSSSGSAGAADFPGRRRWFAYFDGFAANVTAFDETTLTTVFNQPWYGGIDAINPATRRVYVWRRFYDPFGPDLAPPEVRVIDADTTATQVFSPPGSFFSASDVNVATNKVYGIGYLSEGGPTGIVEIDEPVAAAVPMPTTITPGTPSFDGSVTVDFSATSSWVPYDHDVLRIVYQVDSVRGRWLRGSADGDLMQATITGLGPGEHTIYAMATNGLEGRVGEDYTVVTGPIASATVTIPPPPACANGADDDGDGLTDYPADPGCRDASSIRENPKCDDDADNDGDGGIDWDGGSGGSAPDSSCGGYAYRDREAPAACGLGAELALCTVVLARLRRRRSTQR